MNRKSQAVLIDIFFLAVSFVTAVLVLGLSYKIILGLASAVSGSPENFVVASILGFYKGLDFSMGMAFVAMSIFSLYLASKYSTTSAFIPIWIIVFLLLIYISSSISAIYRGYANTPELVAVFNQLFVSKMILSHFEFWFLGLGVIGLVMTYGKPEGLNVDMGGFG